MEQKCMIVVHLITRKTLNIYATYVFILFFCVYLNTHARAHTHSHIHTHRNTHARALTHTHRQINKFERVGRQRDRER